jgi:KaiC/GvpD/RAD55 family RecA-like ATPase
MAEFKYHTRCDKCGSKDNLAVYSDGSYFCFSYCGNKSASQEYIASLEDNNKSKSKRNNFKSTKEKEEVVLVEKSSKPIITEDQKQEIRSCTSFDDTNYRHITQDTYKFFGVRTGFDTDDNPIVHYYPCTQNSELVGYKVRELPKQFGGNLGRTGKECELFGQFRFKNPDSKYCLIVGGEIDVLSAYQMLMDYNKRKGNDYDVVVVSPTIGETGCEKQLAAQYEWFAQFEKIIVGFDNDKAGKEATEKAVSVLPKGKVFVAHWSHKDPNEYLKNDDERLFISDYYNAEKYVPVGVVGSSSLYDRVLNQTKVPKVEFPSFMGILNDIFVGGMPLGHIINVAADTGLGKTTLVNEMVYFWVFHSPHKVGIVSMELDTGQYGEVLLSRHLRRKLSLIGDVDEKVKVIASDHVKQKADELFKDENGNDRFYVLDNRDGSIEEIQETVEQLVIACGCKLIVLDPLQDLLDGLSNEEQAVFMKWAKGFIKSHNVLFVFVNHMRKTPAGQQGGDNEQNIMGSSTIIKSASANILLRRNKMAENPIVRNTTFIDVPKNRVCGITGPAGGVFYENETHTLHNLDQYLNDNNLTLPEDEGKR